MSSFVFTSPGPAPSGGPTLLSIKVTPNPAFVRIQAARPFIAIGEYNDGSTANVTSSATWASSSTAIATVGAGTGVAQGVAAGTVTITATIGAVVGTAAMTVAPAAARVGNEQLVVSIEGIRYLVTQGPTDKVIQAYADTDWENAGEVLDGLFVSAQDVMELHPYDPFVGGGTCTLMIHADPATGDVFGRATARKTAGAETQLTAALDRADGTVNVRSTSQFATQGEAYIGIECFAWTNKTATTLLNCSRGMYAPFPRETPDGVGAIRRWGHQHRYGNEIYGIALEPAVTDIPRVWKGRHVAVRLHAVDAAGNLSPWNDPATKVLFAGTIEMIDWQRGYTVVVLSHLQERLRKQTIGRRLWHGKVRDGLYLRAGGVVTMQDSNGVAGKTANDLVVVPSGAVAPNQLNEGYYTIEELISALNEWLAAELTATRLYGTYTFSPTSTDLGWRVKNAWRLNGAALDVSWRMTVPRSVASFLGLIGAGGSSLDDTSWDSQWVYGQDDQDEEWFGGTTPFRALIAQGVDNPLYGTEFRTQVADTFGAIVDQQAFFPGVAGGPDVDDSFPDSPFGHYWGLFLVDGRVLVRASWVPASLGAELQHVQVINQLGGDEFTSAILDYAGRLYGEEGALEIRQVLYLSGKVRDIAKAMFYSTGTTGYNGANDVLGYGIGAALPHEVLGPTFDASLDALTGGDGEILVVIDGDVKFAKKLAIDFVLRRCHLIFDNGHFRWVSWSTPAAELAQWELTEDNKAHPRSNDISDDTSSRETSEYQSPIVNIDYNRGLKDDTYRSHHNLEDLTAVDDLGGAAEARTLAAENTYGDFPGTGAGIEALAPGFLAWHPYWSKPITVAARSFDKSLEAMRPGDIAVISDPWIRNPDDGTWGVTGRPCLTMKVKKDRGGLWPGAKGKPAVRDAVSEVVVAFLHLDRVSVYAPCAQFLGSGYNAGAKTVTTQPHEHSEASAPIADAARFAAGQAVRFVEIDPPNPATPRSYLRNLVSVTGNDVVHDGVALGTGGGETAFDAGKTYRMISQAYLSATATQKRKVYQADDADGYVQDVLQPYQLGAIDVEDYTRSAHTDAPERYAQLQYGDGAPLDTGYARGLARMVNNLYDHKAAVQSPALDSTVAGASVGGGATWMMTHMVPIFLGVGELPAFINRYVYVAPTFRSKTGASVSCRVTLSPAPAQGDSLVDVTIPPGSSSATFTTTSTSFTTPAELGLDLRAVQPGTGIAFLIIEGSNDMECIGLGECVVREREIPVP